MDDAMKTRDVADGWSDGIGSSAGNSRLNCDVLNQQSDDNCERR